MGDRSSELIADFLNPFYTPLIIVAMSRFYLGLTLLVVTEAAVFVVFLLLLRLSFTACYIGIYFQYTLLSIVYDLQPLFFPMSTPFSL